jgi:hypothetical protein
MDYRTEAEGYYQHTEETAHFRQARAPPSEKRERRQRERERERERDTERERAREREREVWGGGQREVNGRVTAHNQKIAWGRSSGVKAVQAWGMRHGSWAWLDDVTVRDCSAAHILAGVGAEGNVMRHDATPGDGAEANVAVWLAAALGGDVEGNDV